jgi:hypothetical protein
MNEENKQVKLNSELLNKFLPTIYFDSLEKSKCIDPNIYLETNKIIYSNKIIGHIRHCADKIYLYYFIFLHNNININYNFDFQNNNKLYDNNKCGHRINYFTDIRFSPSNYPGDVFISAYSPIVSTYFDYQCPIKRFNIIGLIVELDENNNFNGICIMPDIVKEYNNKYSKNKKPFWIKNIDKIKTLHEIKSKGFVRTGGKIGIYISKDLHNIYTIFGNIIKYKDYIGYQNDNDIFNKIHLVEFNLDLITNYVFHRKNYSFLEFPIIFDYNLDEIEINDLEKIRWKKYKYKIFGFKFNFELEFIL